MTIIYLINHSTSKRFNEVWRSELFHQSWNNSSIRIGAKPELDTWLAPEKFRNMNGEVEPVYPFAVKISNRPTA